MKARAKVHHFCLVAIEIAFKIDRFFEYIQRLHQHKVEKFRTKQKPEQKKRRRWKLTKNTMIFVKFYAAHSCRISPAACYHFFGKHSLSIQNAPCFIISSSFGRDSAFHRIESFRLYTFFSSLELLFSPSDFRRLFFALNFVLLLKCSAKDANEWQTFSACHTLGHFPKTSVHKICVSCDA